MPRLVAVEPFPRLSLVMGGADPHRMFDGKSLQSSVAGNTVTLQSVLALQKTGGAAIVIDDQKAIQARQNLAKHDLHFELCAAAAWAAYALEQTNELPSRESGLIGSNDVVIATAHSENDAHLFSNDGSLK